MLKPWKYHTKYHIYIAHKIIVKTLHNRFIPTPYKIIVCINVKDVNIYLHYI